MNGHGFNFLGEVAYRTDMLQSIPAQVIATGDKLAQALFLFGVKNLVFNDTADADLTTSQTQFSHWQGARPGIAQNSSTAAQPAPEAPDSSVPSASANTQPGLSVSPFYLGVPANDSYWVLAA